jgi:hypothetical protein
LITYPNKSTRLLALIYTKNEIKQPRIKQLSKPIKQNSLIQDNQTGFPSHTSTVAVLLAELPATGTHREGEVC